MLTLQCSGCADQISGGMVVSFLSTTEAGIGLGASEVPGLISARIPTSVGSVLAAVGLAGGIQSESLLVARASVPVPSSGPSGSTIATISFTKGPPASKHD